MNQQPLPDHPLRLLHLGDSYTIGEGVEKADSWPEHFRNLLQAQGHRIEESMTIAKTGWTTADLLEAVREADPPSGWDLITLCIGANNQYQDRSIQEYKAELRQLIDSSRSLLSSPKGQIYLLSIPDWSVTPFAGDRNRAAVRSQLNLFNNAGKRIAREHAVPFLDWTALTRQFRFHKDAYIEDGLHPNSLQYKAWAEFLLQQFE